MNQKQEPSKVTISEQNLQVQLHPAHRRTAKQYVLVVIVDYVVIQSMKCFKKLSEKLPVMDSFQTLGSSQYRNFYSIDQKFTAQCQEYKVKG